MKHTKQIKENKDYNNKQKTKRFLFGITMMVLYYFMTLTDGNHHTPKGIFGFWGYDDFWIDQTLTGIIMFIPGVGMWMLIAHGWWNSIDPWKWDEFVREQEFKNK